MDYFSRLQHLHPVDYLLIICLALASSTTAAQEVDGGTSPTDIATQLLGLWESETEDRYFTLELDGSRTNPGGDIKGNAAYNVRGGAIITAYLGAILAYDVSFPAEDEALWVERATGRRVELTRLVPEESDAGVWERMGLAFERFARGVANEMQPLPETEAGFVEKLQGYWQGGRGRESYRLHVDTVDLTLVGDNDTITSPYLLIGHRIRYNARSGIVAFNITFEADDDTMVWTSPTAQRRIRFQRSGPFSVESADLKQLLAQ